MLINDDELHKERLKFINDDDLCKKSISYDEMSLIGIIMGS